MRTNMLKRIAASSAPLPFVDIWFMDDGDAVVLAKDVERFLRLLDEEGGKLGLSRSKGEACKTEVRILAPPEHSVHQEVSSYVRESAKILPWATPHKTLGVMMGGEEAFVTQFRSTTAKVKSLQEQLLVVQDPATELTLMRKCAEICKVVHLLRGAPYGLPKDVLAAFDAVVPAFLDRVLVGGVGEKALAQSRIGEKHGGLGLRRAADVELPARIGSRATAELGVLWLLQDLVELGWVLP
jgi:hypothetical protein